MSCVLFLQNRKHQWRWRVAVRCVSTRGRSGSPRRCRCGFRASSWRLFLPAPAPACRGLSTGAADEDFIVTTLTTPGKGAQDQQVDKKHDRGPPWEVLAMFAPMATVAAGEIKALLHILSRSPAQDPGQGDGSDVSTDRDLEEQTVEEEAADLNAAPSLRLPWSEVEFPVPAFEPVVPA
ncbi:unnamed protein product [Amoebophrya sp. A120]|nr:unnamed protein product [Amoebophrya sp. A120]|eukprot:GSA120T00001497001.1